MAATVVAVVDDLFFLAKIRETAKAVGVEVITADARRGTDSITEARPQTIFLDLSSRPIAAIDWIRTIKADPSMKSIRIVAFASHVQGALIAEARGAGCEAVLARSAFTSQLPRILSDLAREYGRVDGQST